MLHLLNNSTVRYEPTDGHLNFYLPYSITNLGFGWPLPMTDKVFQRATVLWTICPTFIFILTCFNTTFWNYLRFQSLHSTLLITHSLRTCYMYLAQYTDETPTGTNYRNVQHIVPRITLHRETIKIIEQRYVSVFGLIGLSELRYSVT